MILQRKSLSKMMVSFAATNCPKFATSVRLLARTHAQTCGSKKKQVGRKPKMISCLECGASCEGKKGLSRHFKAIHIISSYTCSQCLKSFKSRAIYVKHLKIHDKVGVVKCPHCPKTFKFESYKKRHIQRVHIMAIKVTECLSKVKSDEEDLDIEVDLRESKAGEEFIDR